MKKWTFMLPFLLTAVIGPHISKQSYFEWIFTNGWWLAILFLIGFSYCTHPEMWSKD